MRNIKLTLEYDGSKFAGWQIQAKGFRTVQNDLTTIARKIFKEKINILGSGRTDSGVHALGQVAHFKTQSSMPLATIIRAFNGNLEKDISVLKAEEVPLKFHAQHSAKEKTYRYTILNRKARCSLYRNTCFLFPHTLNLARMKKEAKSLLGKKDFRSFQSTNSSNKETKTIRTIKQISIKKAGDFIYIDMTANGFLYRMVRNIVGTLLELGSKNPPQISVAKILRQKNRAGAGQSIPPQGLCLMNVKY